MNLTALRTLLKINSNVLQNPCRLHSFKFEMTPAGRISQDKAEDAVEQAEEAPRYRNLIEKPPSDAISVQRQTVRAAIEQQHLQPAMLPEYYQKQMEKNALIHPEPEPSEELRINHPISQRRFQMSKTCANATFPLKSVKLASPFPEPVKMMMSRTVSDDEKAEQMLADSRSQRSFSGGRPQNGGFRSFVTETKRWYSKNHDNKEEGSSATVSSNSDKCKKFNRQQVKKVGCPTMVLHNCPPRTRLRCDRVSREIDCKKQEAPYPAYSEFCHEELDEKPSECKMCPWKAEENPNFKPQKKKMHTSTNLLLKRSGLELDWDEYSRRLGEDQAVQQQAEAEEIAAEEVEGMQCDLRKPPCERPKNRRCPPTEKEKREKKEEEKKKEKPKEECAGLAEILNEAVLPDAPVVQKQYENVISLKDDKKKQSPHGSCKIRKFKFPDCAKPKKKKEEEAAKVDKCNPKKKKRRIVDCPGEGEEGQKCAEIGNVEYVLSEEGGKQKHDKVKCPKIDLTINKPPAEEEDEDPCKKKRKGVTRICPGDLLKKKRKKPKKTSGNTVAPVNTKQKEMPQPTIKTM